MILTRYGGELFRCTSMNGYYPPVPSVPRQGVQALEAGCNKIEFHESVSDNYAAVNAGGNWFLCEAKVAKSKPQQVLTQGDIDESGSKCVPFLKSGCAPYDHVAMNGTLTHTHLDKSLVWPQRVCFLPPEHSEVPRFIPLAERIYTENGSKNPINTRRAIIPRCGVKGFPREVFDKGIVHCVPSVVEMQNGVEGSVARRVNCDFPTLRMTQNHIHQMETSELKKKYPTTAYVV